MATSTKRPGFYGWRLLFFLAVVMVAGGYNFYGPPALFPTIIESTGWSRGETSLGLTMNLLMTGFAAPFTAWSINRVGARLTLAIGGVIAASGTFLASLLGDSYPLYLLSFGVITGLGLSLATALPAQTVAVFWFHRYRALALSLIMAGVATGGFIAPPLINAVVSASGGSWRPGWLSMSIFLLVAAVVAIIFVRNRPEDMGQHPDGKTPEEVQAFEDSGGSAGRTFRSSLDWSPVDAIRNRQFWLLAVGVVGGFFVWNVITSQASLHLRDRGFDPSSVSLIYGVAVGLTLVGRLGAGFLGDRIEPRLIFLAALVLGLAGETLFWLASPQAAWATWTFPVFSGVAAGAIIVCMPAIIGNYYGAGAFPAINAILMPIWTIVNSLASPFAGFTYDMQGSYLPALLVAGAGLLAAIVAMFFCTPPAHRGVHLREPVTETETVVADDA